MRMKGVLHLGGELPWTLALGCVPWPLLPLGNRPLLEYWFELCVDLGIAEVHLVLDDGAEPIEAFAGDGCRWGLHIEYHFLRDGRPPLSFLQRSPGQWHDGLLFLSGPLFPRRLAASGRVQPTGEYAGGSNGRFCVLGRAPAFLEALGRGAVPDSGARPFADLGLDLVPLDSAKAFFDMNMRLVGGEVGRYLAPDYGAADGSFVGYDVIIPPSAVVTPAVIIGNDCRIGALATVGPNAVIGNHVVIDRQAELLRCVVLDGTYVGQQVEIRDKIVAGRRLIDPADGVVLDLEESCLLASVVPTVRLSDMWRALLEWPIALLLLAVQFVPFVVFRAGLGLFGQGRFEPRTVHGTGGRLRRMSVFRVMDSSQESRAIWWFRALALDLFPRVAAAACGRLWLCGHEPLRAPEDNWLREELTSYFPAVFSAATSRRGEVDPAVPAMEARYYVHRRGLCADARILWEAIVGRLSLHGSVGTAKSTKITK